MNKNLFKLPEPMSAVTNISCYRFAPLKELKPLRERLVRLCTGWELRGTILLSTEGILSLIHI